MPQSLKFRSDETNKIVDVPFYDAYAFGVVRECIRLADGSIGRLVKPETQKQELKELEKPIVSDSLGFIAEQLADFEHDRVRNGFSGVEFLPDPKVPGFMQVKVGSVKEWRRYMKHRGLADRNSSNGSGAGISASDLANLRRQMRAKYGDAAEPEKQNGTPLT